MAEGFAWAPNDLTNDDWGGTGENQIRHSEPEQRRVAELELQRSKFRLQQWRVHPIPCYGQGNGNCIPFASAPISIWQVCSAAAVAPYGNSTENVGGTTVALSELALAALTSKRGACYIQKGGILTPPAYGTLGNAGRGLFKGPPFTDVDLSLQKVWKFKEKYSAQFRFELYNVFNHVNYAQFSDGSSDPSGGGGPGILTGQGSGSFGFVTGAQTLSGTGSGNRQMEFGLKFLF